MCRIKHAKRVWNKLIGRPSTPEVGIIADLLGAHRTTIDRRLKKQRLRVQRAILAIPEVPQLSWQDWQDAMEYCKLELLNTNKHLGHNVPEVSAALAGSAHGLCEHYTDIDTCEDEEADMPESYILAVSLSQSCFSVTYTYTQSAITSILEKEVTRVDLGLGALNSSKGHSDYWVQLRNAIIDVGRSSPRPLTTLLILGEEGDNPSFRKTVQEALRELLPQPLDDLSMLSELSSDSSLDLRPLWLAARGAAEFAKRTQESPAGCREPPRCVALRRSSSDEGSVWEESSIDVLQQSVQIEL